ADTLYVMYEFVDNNQDQNIFQCDSLKLSWKFEGKQGPGEAK
ncbi:MAG: TasA family protein, partial [Mesobacillus sp.]